MSDFKDVTIGDEKFRVGRMTAMVGSSIMVKLLPLIIPYLDEIKGLEIASIIKMLPSIPTEDFTRYQIESMKVSYTVVEGAPVPIMMVNGKWANKRLEYDPIKVTALTAHALVFNLSPFFINGGLKTIMESVMGTDSNQSDSQT